MTKLIKWLQTQEALQNKKELILLVECLTPNILGILLNSYIGIILALIVLLYHFLKEEN